MANLAQRDAPISTVGQSSAHTDYTLPPRRNVDGQTSEVNAPIVGPNPSKAQVLAQILGVAQDFGQELVGQGMDRQAKKDAAAGLIAGQAGGPADQAAVHRAAYADAYYTAGAQRTGYETVSVAKQAVQDLFNDPNNPPTLAEVNGVLDHHFAAVALDEHGQPRNHGSPKAAAEMARIFAATRAEIIPQAAELIKHNTDAKVIDNHAFVLATQGLPPLPGTGIPATSSPAAPAAPAAPAVQLAPPTGRLPVSGTPTSSFSSHLARGSAGLDLAAPHGSPVELPASGRVIEVGHDARSGNYVRVDHGNGVISSYAHLSKADVTRGQELQAGDTVGAVGNTGHVVSANGGDGSHLHYRIKVNGKDVDPASFQFAAGASATAAAPAPDQKPSEALRPRYDFEAALAQLPPTIDRATAKKGLLTSLITYADKFGKPELLDGIWDSKRSDGTPSFNPDEMRHIVESADQIRNKMRIEAKQAEDAKYEAGANALLTKFLQNGQSVSHQEVLDGINNKSISPQFGYTLLSHIRAEQKADEAQAKSEARYAEAQANQEKDIELSGMIVGRQSGDLTGSSLEEDTARFNRGEFGVGKRAMARFQQARAAAKAGMQYQLQSPDGATWGAHLSDLYQVKRVGSSLLERAQGASGATPELRAAALASYRDNIAHGMEPSTAAAKAVKDHPLPTQGGSPRDQRAALEARRRELEAKK